MVGHTLAFAQCRCLAVAGCILTPQTQSGECVLPEDPRSEGIARWPQAQGLGAADLAAESQLCCVQAVAPAGSACLGESWVSYLLSEDRTPQGCRE